MQRCCARIAGLKTPVRPRPSTYYIAYRRYAHHSPTLKPETLSPSLGQETHNPRLGQETHSPGLGQEEDFESLVGADNATFDTLARGLKSPSRQASIRHAKALHKDGFSYISAEKLPARESSRSTKAWMPAIEAALPPRLRTPAAVTMTDQTYSAQDISRIIHISSYTYNLDLLTHLAFDQHRPKAAVWLASMAISHNFKPEPIHRDTNVWNNRLDPRIPLKEFTEQDECDLSELPLNRHLDDSHPAPSLDQLTAELHPHEEPLPNILRHETIGQIWESLARMIIKDAARANKDPSNQAIKPEILEIIAMLHHTGAMPSSIYSYQPPDDSVSLCQPPTLHLLSNQIITSLTDAAWRAHETNVIEEARERGGVYESLRPEIPGSMYKVHVTGLGHEIWLELVLWACLYGRFYNQGSRILMNLAKQKGDNNWSVLSWRELANPIIQSGQEKSINWDEVKYIFNTGIADTDQMVNKKKVRRTVSAEVIASFVDAVVSHVSAGVGSRGMAPDDPAEFLTSMKNLFGRNNMSLGFTSWDAMILRFFESRGVDFEKDPALARKVNLISSMFGDDIATVNAPTRDQLWQPTPAYVLDGTAAIIGYHHRLLRAYIKLGSLRGATGVVQGLQRLTDINKERSIQEFFKKQQDLTTQDDVPQDDAADTSDFEFEGRYGGIHYPSFFPQIPVHLLADFLNLVVDSNDLELGSWLVYSQDLDGPIIHKELYSDPAMGPPLVRLAASLADKDLMSKVFDNQRRKSGTNLPKEVLTALLDQQIEAANWPFVEKALDNFAQLPGYNIGTITTATLVRTILREAKSCDGDLTKLEKSASSKAFQRMARFQTSGTNHGYRRPQDTVSSELGTTIWHLLALVNDNWREYAWKAYPKMAYQSDFGFVPRTFNVILDAVVDNYGSVAGKEYLGKFWPESLRQLPSRPSNHNDTPGGVPRMAARREDTTVLTTPFVGKNSNKHRIHIDGPGKAKGRLNVYMRSNPNIATIRIILKAALQEHEGQHEYGLIRQEVDWARNMMKRLGLGDRHIQAEFNGLPELENYPEAHAANEDDWVQNTPFGVTPNKSMNDGLKGKADEMEDES